MCGKSITVCIIFFYYLILKCNCTFQCKDENDNPVDWYVIYKLPRLHNSTVTLINDGFAYAYITSESLSKGWILSNRSINNEDSIPGYTLRPLYETGKFRNSPYVRVLYNDQTPDGFVSFTAGHTKGVVMSDISKGFWLVHSVPHFPAAPTSLNSWQEENDINYWTEFMKTKYHYPSTGRSYGQSFLCMNFDITSINLVGTQLTFNAPNIYDSYISDDMESLVPEINAAIKKEFIAKAPLHHVAELKTIEGSIFKSFAKTGNFDKDLYSDLVSEYFNDSIFVESWCNGEHVLNSECSKTFKTENVANITIFGDHFSSHHDHSKWAITQEKTWICVGDINRMADQFHRGGGTVCTNNSNLWKNYKSTISGVEKCPPT